jgi:hypothetical protein
VASPVLANVVLHELDDWLIRHYGVNPPPESAQARNARSNPAYMRLHYRINDLRRYLDGKRPLPKGMTVETARQELRETLRLRAQQPRSLPRRVLYYARYADDVRRRQAVHEDTLKRVNTRERCCKAPTSLRPGNRLGTLAWWERPEFCTLRQTTEGQARLDMARAELPKGQFRAVPA